MTDFDYKKYSLKQLKEWVDNAVLSSEASPQEIYDVIKESVDENYYYFKHHTGRCYELLALLNGNGAGHIEAYDDYVNGSMRPWGHSDLEYQVANESLSCDKNDTSPECKGAWNDFWESKEDKVVKWQLPVELDGLSGDLYITLPDDLLEQVGWKEGDTVEYVPSENGFYVMRKV